MRQINVTRTTKDTNGTHVRHMTIPEDTWNRMVKDGVNTDKVYYELRKAEKITAEPIELIDSTDPNQPNGGIESMDLDELRTLAKSKGIKGCHRMKKETLLTKLADND